MLCRKGEILLQQAKSDSLQRPEWGTGDSGLLIRNKLASLHHATAKERRKLSSSCRGAQLFQCNFALDLHLQGFGAARLSSIPQLALEGSAPCVQSVIFKRATSCKLFQAVAGTATAVRCCFCEHHSVTDNSYPQVQLA